MSELLPISVGVGMVASLLLGEVFGLATGGLIVPGYLALYLTRPYALLATIGVALVTLLSVKAISSFVILFGRRRTTVMLLLGYILAMALRQMPDLAMMDYDVIGYVIPGLIALWMDRQGVPATLASLGVLSVLTRLVLIAAVGMELGA